MNTESLREFYSWTVSMLNIELINSTVHFNRKGTKAAFIELRVVAMLREKTQVASASAEKGPQLYEKLALLVHCSFRYF